MATPKKKPRVKFIYRRSSVLLKVVVIATIVLSTVAILFLNREVNRAKAREEELRQEAIDAQRYGKELEEYIAKHGTVEGIRRYAIEVLGLVDPNTTFYNPEQTD